MAANTRITDMRLKVDVDNSQAIPALDETGKAVEDLQNKSKGASKGTKKDWGGVADLFSNLLPRGMQRTIRGFKSSQRSIKRLGKGFTVLNKANLL